MVKHVPKIGSAAPQLAWLSLLQDASEKIDARSALRDDVSIFSEAASCCRCHAIPLCAASAIFGTCCGH